MSWAIGFDDNWKRDIGYGVPAYCDHPGCTAEIDRGLAHVCGGEPYGGEHGCGLFFCRKHLIPFPSLCERCSAHLHDSADWRPFEPKPEHPQWIEHKMTCPSWMEWRANNPSEVGAMLRVTLNTEPVK